MKEFDKQEAEARIASIEAEAERLREWLSQQNTKKSQAAPEVDEVWDNGSGRRFLMTCTCEDDKQHCELPTDTCEAEIYNDAYEEEHFIKRLGTFEEVYVDRTKLREEGYIHKDEIKRMLTEDFYINPQSQQTRLSIAAQLGIIY